MIHSFTQKLHFHGFNRSVNISACAGCENDVFLAYIIHEFVIKTNKFIMGTDSRNWFKVIQVILFFVTVQAVFSCAVLPGENEMLVGRILLELTTSDKDSSLKHSASFVQPVENEKVRTD